MIFTVVNNSFSALKLADSDPSLCSASCQAIGEIGRSIPLPFPDDNGETFVSFQFPSETFSLSFFEFLSIR